MKLKILPKSAFSDWINQILHDYRLVGPVRQGNHTTYNPIRSSDELTLEISLSFLPVKKYLLPPHETLLNFNLSDENIHAIFDTSPTVIFGVHSCDLHAIRLLDHVYLNGFEDQHYKSRRDSYLLVSIECFEPCSDSSFCRDVGALSLPEQFDLHLVDLGDVYAAKVGSQAGADLINNFHAFRDASKDEKTTFSRLLSEKWDHFPYRLHGDTNALPGLVKANYQSPVWQQLGERCLGCGVCTLTCPTCYCFDMVDQIDLYQNIGNRCRVWDSCLFPQYASVADGHNYRPTKADRLRHRFLRKFSYQTVEPGLLGCVGCGRCERYCLVEISPIEILNKFHQQKPAKRHKRQEAIVA